MFKNTKGLISEGHQKLILTFYKQECQLYHNDSRCKDNRNYWRFGKGMEIGAQGAFDEGKKTIDSITGLEVTDITAKVYPNSAKITQYRVTVKIAFGVEHS